MARRIIIEYDEDAILVRCPTGEHHLTNKNSLQDLVADLTTLFKNEGYIVDVMEAGEDG